MVVLGICSEKVVMSMPERTIPNTSELCWSAAFSCGTLNFQMVAFAKMFGDIHTFSLKTRHLRCSVWRLSPQKVFFLWACWMLYDNQVSHPNTTTMRCHKYCKLCSLVIGRQLLLAPCVKLPIYYENVVEYCEVKDWNTKRVINYNCFKKYFADYLGYVKRTRIHQFESIQIYWYINRPL